MTEKTFRYARRALLVLAACTAFTGSAFAQAWPTKGPIKLVVNFPPGGAADVIGRALAQQLSDALKQQVVVENKPGANGNLGADAVAKSPNDGYTLLMSSGGAMTVNPFIYTKMPFDAEKDLVPVASVARVLVFLMTNPSVPVANVKEFVDYAKANPGKLSYGSAGTGSSPHLAGEMFARQAGFQAQHIPYKGAAQVGQAIMAGEIDIAFMGYTGAAPAIDKGAARIFGVTNAERLARMNTIPTMQELGVKGMVISASMGFFAPSGLPRDVNAKLYEAIAAALQNPEVVAKFDQLGLVAALQPPVQCRHSGSPWALGASTVADRV